MLNDIGLRIDDQNGKIRISKVKQTCTLTMKVSGGSGNVPRYSGEYTVTPKPYEPVVLETAGLQMEQDVTVHEIPYWETANPKGGETIYIGGTL